MKNLLYKRLVTVLRVMVVISMLFQQNGIIMSAASTSSTFAAKPLIQNNSSLQTTDTPIAYGFDYPVGKKSDGSRDPNGLNYNPSPSHPGSYGYVFLQDTKTKWGLHPGQDFNGNCNGGCDRGDPVYSVANGKVIYSGKIQTSYGQTILIEHVLSDGSKIWSLYAHLKDRKYKNGTIVAANDIIYKGDRIGSIGDADGYPSFVDHDHLHFEIRKQYHVASFWPTGWTSAKINEHYADPVAFIKSHKTLSPPCPIPSANQVAFYKYPAPNYCGNEGSNAAFFYDATNLGNEWTKIPIQVPFVPRAVKFPTKKLTADSGFQSDRPYLIRSLLDGSAATAQIKEISWMFTSLNVPVVLQTWRSALLQKWQIKDVGNNEHQLISLQSNLCLSLSGLNKGAVVIQTPCDDDKTKWKLEPINNISGDFQIRNSRTNFVLDYPIIPGALNSSSVGKQLMVNSQLNIKSQQWHVCEATQIALQANIENGVIIKSDTDDFKPGTNSFLLFENSKCDTQTTAQSSDVVLAAATSFSCNLPPNQPTPQSPANNYVREDTAPTLSWFNGGDPENNPLNYQVEIISSSGSITSPWMENLRWRPANLDYKYGSYQWRVRARDLDLALSDWSPTRTFTIQSPNRIPEITLNTANELTNSIIFSRETTWVFKGVASDYENQLKRVEFRCTKGTGDNCGTQSTHTGTTTWAHTQTGMSGRTEITFVAVDGKDQTGISRLVTLNIDLAAPTTMPSLNGESNPSKWNTWYTAPVTVNLKAIDNGTGRATVGMGKIHYRVDNGTWQVVSGGSVPAFTISTDGVHTVDYYSEDALGNTEAQRSFNVQIDQTAPSLPVNLRESHGVVNDQWQKIRNIPTFIWNPASDATSGVRGYQFYFGDDPNGIGYKDILASEPLQWIPFPAGVPTGTYYLRGRTQDVAGNWSAWDTLFTFRYDGTPPENPAEEDVSHASVNTTVWQNASAAADFAWTPAHDEGSGIQGYYVYWGEDPEGTSSTLITADTYQDLAPLCTGVCTGYLRLRSVDNVGHLAEDWNTVFILRYDNVAPLVDFSFIGGTYTTQTQVTLDVTSSDEGSGVHAMRFSLDGTNWTNWEEPAPQRQIVIPPISRQSWPVFAQVQDGVGLLSDVVSYNVYLDVNPLQPTSDNYRLFNSNLSGGSGGHTSGNYAGHGTIGQTADSPLSASNHYQLFSGYEANSSANPVIVPGHEEFVSQGGSFTSGTISAPMESAGYQLQMAFGEIGLPAVTTIESASYQHQPGFLAGLQPVEPEPPFIPQEVAQIEMPEPDPIATPACDAPSVFINDDAPYTEHLNVALSLCAPYATEMMVSAQADFAGAVWEPFAASRAWTLSAAGSTVEPLFVYAQFKDMDGRIHATYFDDILYDPNQPGGELLLTDDIPLPAPEASGQVSAMGVSALASPSVQTSFNTPFTLYVDGFDDNSGIVEMQISESADFSGAAWQPFAPALEYTPAGEDGPRTVYSRLKDKAGNISGLTAVNIIFDTEAPLGYIYADPAVLPSDADTVTFYLGDYSGWEEYYEGEEPPPAPTFDGTAVEMRLGDDPALADSYWQPLAESVTIPIDSTQPEGAYYAQFRDAAGNVSDIVNATYQIDTFAPELSAMAEPDGGTDRIIYIYAQDDLAGVAKLHLSNDPLMQTDVVTQDYVDTLTWTFDDNKVLWIVAEDWVGNKTEPYPVYATEKIVTISGNVSSSGVGLAGATITYTGGSTTTDADGNYYFTVVSRWNGTVTPSKVGYNFTPANRTYTDIRDDQSAQDYSAAIKTYVISGNAGIAGATISYTGGSATATADDKGNYSFTVQHGWSGRAIPSLTGYGFLPAERSYSNVTSNHSAQNYKAGNLVAPGFRSLGANDGWTLESSEFSNVAGMKSNTSYLRIGDDARNRQYKSILSFNTASLPDNAIIVKVTLRLKKMGLAGKDPFATHGNLIADIKKGFFGLATLELGDFKAAGAPIQSAGVFRADTDNWYQLTLNPLYFQYLNLTGSTQFRLRFERDDDNDRIADYLNIYSGDYTDVARRPVLSVEYYVP